MIVTIVSSTTRLLKKCPTEAVKEADDIEASYTNTTQSPMLTLCVQTLGVIYDILQCSDGPSCGSIVHWFPANDGWREM